AHPHHRGPRGGPRSGGRRSLAGYPAFEGRPPRRARWRLPRSGHRRPRPRGRADRPRAQAAGRWGMDGSAVSRTADPDAPRGARALPRPDALLARARERRGGLLHQPIPDHRGEGDLDARDLRRRRRVGGGVREAQISTLEIYDAVAVSVVACARRQSLARLRAWNAEVGLAAVWTGGALQ